MYQSLNTNKELWLPLEQLQLQTMTDQLVDLKWPKRHLQQKQHSVNEKY